MKRHNVLHTTARCSILRSWNMGHDDDIEQHSRDRVGGRPPGKPHVSLLRADTETAGGLAYVTCHTHTNARTGRILQIAELNSP